MLATTLFRNACFLLTALACTAGPALAAAGQASLFGLDANHDGVISRAEAIRAQSRAFDHLDGNGDGVISRSELKARGRGMPANTKLSATQKRQRARARNAWFNNLDANGDGRISRAEYQAGLTPYFDRLDRNGDGVIEPNELKKAFPGGALRRH